MRGARRTSRAAPLLALETRADGGSIVRPMGIQDHVNAIQKAELRVEQLKVSL